MPRFPCLLAGTCSAPILFAQPRLASNLPDTTQLFFFAPAPPPPPPPPPREPHLQSRRRCQTIITVVPTASHASSSGRGASATAGRTSDFPTTRANLNANPIPIHDHHPNPPSTSLTVPAEDAHLNIDSTNPYAASANPRVPSPSFQPPYPSPIATSPRPRRWSLRNAFSPLTPPPLNLQARHGLSAPHIQPRTSSRNILRPRTGGRLWNPTNSTPRTLRPRSPDLEAGKVVPVPLQHPQIGGQAAAGDAGGDYPLLTLQEQRQSRHSGTGTPRASLQVEYNSSASGSTRISLPRSVSLDVRRSAEFEGDREKKGKGKEVEGDYDPKSAGSRKRRPSASGPPVALKQQLDSLERKQSRKKEKGKGRAREIDLTMAPPDLESGPSRPSHTYSQNDRAALPPTNRSLTSLSHHSGTGPALTISSHSSLHGSARSVVLPGADAEWGPSHPCYPHLNPHVPVSSPLYASTRIIRVRRDWMLEGDLAPTFSGLYPEILADAGLGEGEFRRVVQDVNTQLVQVFNPFSWRNVLDAVLGLVTGWVWDDVGWTGVKKGLRQVEERLERWNREMETGGSASGAGPVAARFMPLRRSGYMTLDIQIPTPQIGEVDDEDDDEDDDARRHATPVPGGSQHVASRA